MIYKIEGKFEDFDNLIPQISSKYIFLFLYRTLYVCPKNYDDTLDLSKIFDDEYYDIVLIDQSNIMHEGPVAIDWIRDNYVRLEIQRYNANEQDRLHKLWDTLDKFEEDLKEKERRKKENG